MKRKIKILHVVGFLGKGGDSTAIFNILDYSKKNKNDFQFDFITHAGCDENIVLELKKRGHKIFIIDGDVRKLGTFKYFKTINKILKINKYDCIHFHTSFQSVVGLLAAKINKIKIRICHSHTTSVQRKCNKIKKIFYLPICRVLIRILSTKMVGCSTEANRYLFGNTNKSIVIHNGLNIENLNKVSSSEIKKIKQLINYRKDYKIIGQVGRITDMKNPFFTLNLAKKLKNKKFIFIFLGIGDLFDEMKFQINKNKLSNVYLLGKVKDVNNYMSLFDYLLVPSKYGEGLPVVLVEQQIVNDKCICIADDKITHEADIGNVKFLSISKELEWLNTLLNVDNLLYSKSTNKEIFDIEYTAKKWLNLYNEI